MTTNISRRQFAKSMGLLGATAVAGMGLAACGSSTSDSGSSDGAAEETKSKIIIGTSTVSIDLANSGVAPLEKMGYEVEVTSFEDYVLPDDALVEGSIDVNFYQHVPYMENYNDSKGADIMMMEPLLYNFYSGIYSTKADSIETLPDGGTVGLATDASNLNEDLKRCQEAGIITLLDEPSSGEFYTFADIVDNPHGYEFVTADHKKYTNMDDYAFVIGTSNTMAEAGVDPTQHLLKKFMDDSLAQGISIMPENADTQWAKDIMSAFTSSEAIDSVPASSGFEPTEECEAARHD